MSPGSVVNFSGIDAAAVCLCLTTIWWCTRMGSRVHRMLLAILGALAGYLGMRMIDLVISILFLGAALILELMSLSAPSE